MAGFLAGLSRGLSLRECGLLANAAGAIATTQLGATSAATGIGGVAEFLRQAGGGAEGAGGLPSAPTGYAGALDAATAGGAMELAEKLKGWQKK